MVAAEMAEAKAAAVTEEARAVAKVEEVRVEVMAAEAMVEARVEVLAAAMVGALAAVRRHGRRDTVALSQHRHTFVHTRGHQHASPRSRSLLARRRPNSEMQGLSYCRQATCQGRCRLPATTSAADGTFLQSMPLLGPGAPAIAARS